MTCLSASYVNDQTSNNLDYWHDLKETTQRKMNLKTTDIKSE